MHVVGDEGWGPAQTYGEAFELLREKGRLSARLAVPLREAAGLRNIIVHRYGELSFERIYEELPRHVRALRSFLAQVARRYARK